MAVTLADIKVIAQESILASKLHLDNLSAFSLRCEPQSELVQNDYLQVPIYNQATGVTAYNASSNNYGTDNGANITTVGVQLSNRSKHTAALNRIALSRFSAEKWIKMQINAVMQAVTTTAYGLVTNANFGAAAFTGAVATFDRPDLADIRNACLKAGLNAEDLTLVLNSDYAAQLIKDSTINTASAYGTNDALSTGALTKIGGFKIIESVLLPGNSENLVGFATDTRGIAIANAIETPKGDTSNLVDFEVITDPDTGFSIGVGSHFDVTTRSQLITVEALYGVAKADGTAIKRLVSA